MPISEVRRVSPRTGRPLKGNEARTEKINLRISKGELQRIQICAGQMGVSRIDAIMEGINLLEAELDKK